MSGNLNKLFIFDWDVKFPSGDDDPINVHLCFEQLTDFLYSSATSTDFFGTIQFCGKLRKIGHGEHLLNRTARITEMARITGHEREDILTDWLPDMVVLDEVFRITTTEGKNYYLFASSASASFLRKVSEYIKVRDRLVDLSL